MNEYFNKLNETHFHQNIIELENYARENHVPIITKDSLNIILTILDLKKAVRILEIGTAIGYSSICMAYNTNRIIDTIERDHAMHQIAKTNIDKFGLSSQINLHLDDALLIDLNKLAKYDVIFIDAAKAQNIKFFERFVPLLKEDGIVITDNLLFHGAVEDQASQTKNVKKMAQKIDEYNHYLQKLTCFKTHFIDSGDGISITYRVNICD